jgi:FAD:protein FMN transferase
MGTTYSVKVIASAVNSVELKAKIDTELIRINDLMSTYQPDSELSRFNRSVVGEWFDISPDTMDVIRIAREINRLSEGSFDITVGPLVNLWGFGPDPASSELPSNEAIAAATARVGFGHLRLGDGKLMKDVDTYVDLSAIAKGYGVDRVTALLDAGGFKNYLVEIGGELGARGLNERGGPWRIAIERPDVAERVPFVTITFSDRGMATSGDYRNYFEKDGIRYSHTIDPATGRPVTHTLASVTVIAPTAALADGLATAIDVMGPEKGLAMAEAHHIAAFAIIKSEGGFVERHTSAFASYF